MTLKDVQHTKMPRSGLSENKLLRKKSRLILMKIHYLSTPSSVLNIKKQRIKSDIQTTNSYQKKRKQLKTRL